MHDHIHDLPLYEVPAAGSGEILGLLITGDGGWASLDQQVSAELALRGISVVGLSSLRYFWHSRTPELAAHDVAEVLRHYLAQWRRTRIVLIGYSFGANVLPFIVNRLPQDLRARVISVNLLAPEVNARFQASVAGWNRASSSPLCRWRRSSPAWEVYRCCACTAKATKTPSVPHSRSTS